MTERRPDDDSGPALARAMADDRFGSKAGRGDTMVFDALGHVAMAAGRGVRALVRRLRSLSP